VSEGHRDTIVCEDAVLVQREAFAGEQFILTLKSPQIAKLSYPGAFVHIRCSPALAMRRPMSVMSSDSVRGEITVLFKVVGRGTDALSSAPIGAELNMLGPIGRGFDIPNANTHPVLLGGGVGIPPMLLLAHTLKAHGITPGLVTMGSEVPFPFTTMNSTLHVSCVDENFTSEAPPRAIPELEAQGIASRLASTQNYAGCFDGFVTDLTRAYVEGLPEATRAKTVLYACGPTLMLKATAELAQGLGLECHVSLEEFMACAVGGCAGCVVPTRDGNKLVMRRVCVDGPVFGADEIVWEQISH